MPQKEAINLFKKKPLEHQATKEKTLTWLSTVGKAIIVSVNIITIGAFLYRVRVDQQRLDLKERIAVQERILLASETFEQEFRAVQEKINLLKEFSSQTPLFDNLDIIEKNIPTVVITTEISLYEEKVAIGADSTNGVALSLLAANLLDAGASDFVLKEAHLRDGSYSVVFEAFF